MSAASTLLNQASRSLQAGALAEAEVNLRQILSQEPNNADALNLLGVVAMRAGKTAAGAELFQRARALAPRNVEIHNNLATALALLKRTNEALDIATAAATLDPHNADTQEILGNILMDQSNFFSAIAAYERGVKLKPNAAMNHQNLGRALAITDDLQRSVAAFEKAVALDPNSVEVLFQLGSSLYELGEIDRAIECFQKAIALNPGHAASHWNRGQALLLKGDLARGWPEFDWRMKIPALNLSPTHLRRPLWDGGNVDGQTILLYSEQGFGDTLQFSRYIPIVADKGAKVVFACSPSLLNLIRQSQPRATVFSNLAAPPRFDVFCPLPSLPRAFDTTIETIPANIPYITADATRIDAWRNRLAGESRLKIGLAWAGSPLHTNDRRRSLPPAALAPLSEATNAAFYNMQLEKEPDPGIPLIDWTNALQNFSDTAALIANLDLIISVDTAVAHLAGAMGKPVWLLLPFVPDWRWMLAREDSPWYPTMRLFRQPRRHDWETPIRQIAAELAQFGNPR
ncbi:MAG: tetratricopeptide repeat protein [Tepidisphaeraceae bacterium]|jgi:tetratricopeptide (TPR) repeat protein